MCWCSESLCNQFGKVSYAIPLAPYAMAPLFLFDFFLTQLSFTDELLVAAVAAFIGTVAFVYAWVRFLNQDAKEKGETEKGYTIGSVVSEALLGFVVFFL